MKSILISGLLLFFLLCTAHSQRVYSKINLEQASQEDLQFYLERAKILRNSGAITMASGPVVSGLGFLLTGVSYSGGSSMMFGTGLVMMIMGPSLLLSGVPFFITGLSRVSKVGRVIGPAPPKLSIIPSSAVNSLSQRIQPGMAVILRF